MRSLKLIFIFAFFFLGIVYWSTGSSRIRWFGKPSFSPDGKNIIFSYKKGWSENIYQAKSNGSQLIKLTFLRGKNYQPAYSSDGKKIVFAHTDSLKYGIPSNLFLIRADGSGLKQLTFGGNNDSAPLFSKDNKRVYFLRAHAFEHYSPFQGSNWHKVDLYSIKPDGTDLRAETEYGYYELSAPDISPDDKSLLMASADFSLLDNLWIFSRFERRTQSIFPDFKDYLETRQHKVAQKNNEYFINFSNPKFENDGTGLLFIWSTGTSGPQGYLEYEIFRLERRDNKIEKITNFHKSISNFSLSPDGKQIVFVLESNWPKLGANELWIMNADGTQPQKVYLQI